jgi:hypothetical protein
VVVSDQLHVRAALLSGEEIQKLERPGDGLGEEKK